MIWLISFDVDHLPDVVIDMDDNIIHSLCLHSICLYNSQCYFRETHWAQKSHIIRPKNRNYNCPITSLIQTEKVDFVYERGELSAKSSNLELQTFQMRNQRKIENLIVINFLLDPLLTKAAKQPNEKQNFEPKVPFE